MIAPARPWPDIGALLERVEDAAPVQAVEELAAALAELVGAREVAFLIADFSGRAVVRLTTVSPGSPTGRRNGGEHASTIPLAGTAYDRVLRTQLPAVRTEDDGARLVLPVSDRGDAIGLVELLLPAEPDAATVAGLRAAAHALAYIVIAARRHTDVFEWGQRTTPFSLAAEIQRRLLPSAYTCEAGQFTLAGWMEPAASVGGDTFDYSLERGSLQVSITDAVGHEVGAALLATLLVGALRNARRRGVDLAGQAGYANAALLEHSEPGQFVTGQVLRVDLDTGSAQIVNAGHPFPLLLRDGRVSELQLAIDLPFGVEPGTVHRLQEVDLRPGDRLVLLTDGMQERNAATLDVAAALAGTADLHPREVVHALGAAAMKATGGDLRDDATLVCLDWHGGPQRPRRSRYGVDVERTSAAAVPAARPPVPGPAAEGRGPGSGR